MSLIEYAGFTLYGGLQLLWFPVAALLVAFIASLWARIAAIEWGDSVKASFDAFLPELGRKLGFPSTITRKDEKYLWHLFSNVMLRRSDRALLLMSERINQISQADQLSKIKQAGFVELTGCTYTVQNGETVSDIAQRFGIPVETLVEVNELEDVQRIPPGQRLRIPSSECIYPD